MSSFLAVRVSTERFQQTGASVDAEAGALEILSIPS
jgi:hypothetical protein